MPQTARKKSTSASSRGGSSNSSKARSSSSSARSTSSTGHAGGAMLEKFMYDSLKDIYWAEKHLLKALPRLKKAATNEELKAALDEHVQVTEEQVARLDQVFELLGKK